MTPRTILVVVLALACGLLAAFGISRLQEGGTAPIPTVPVAYAAIDVRRGEAISPTGIEIRRIPTQLAPEGGIARSEDAAGRIARMPLMKGEPLLEAKLEPKGAKSRLVPPGMRAFNVLASYPRDLDVDSRVDVLFTSGISSGAGAPAARPPVLNVPVWDMPEGTTKGVTGASGPVTLLVDPSQAEALNQGMNNGTLRLLPRNPGDESRPVAIEPPPVPKNESPSLSALIDRGLRAYTIDASSTSARMSGHLRPGDLVDVIQSRKIAPSATPDTVDPSLVGLPIQPPTASRWRNSVLLVHAVKILAINEATDIPAARSIDPTQIHSITLLVDPEQATQLDDGQTNGVLHLSLLNPADRDLPSPEHASMPESDVGESDPAPLIILTTRTLRGTVAGSDRLVITRSRPRARVPRVAPSVAREP